LPDWTNGKPFDEIVISSDGTAPIAFTVSEGDLPTGLTLDSDGKLSGTPTESDTWAFTVKASNAQGYATQAYTITISDEVVLSSGCDILSFQIGEHVGEINDLSITVHVPNGTSVSDVVPTITVSDKATYQPNGVADFSSGTVDYIVTAENGDKKTYVVTVVIDAPPSEPRVLSIDPVTLDGGDTNAPLYANVSAAKNALPTSVNAQLSNGDSISIPVISWTEVSAYDQTTAGVYSFTAVLSVPEGYICDLTLTGTISITQAYYFKASYTKLTIKKNATYQYAPVTNFDGDYTVTYSCTNNALVSVSETGAVKGIKAGIVTITASTTFGGKSYSFTFQVTCSN
jgi:hypothetical protein